MAITERNWEKLSGLALVVGPLQFVVATLIEGALIPGYGLITHWISDLGAPPNDAPHFAPGTDLWWVFSVSLTLMAILVFVGLIGLKPRLWPSRSGKAVIVLVAIVAVGSIGVALFNEVDYLVEHSISALIAFGVGWLALVIFGICVRSDRRWSKAWSWGSFVGGAASFVALVLYVVPTFVGRVNVPSWVAAVYPGGSERAIVLPLVIWLIALGVRLLRGFEAPEFVEAPAPSKAAA